MFRISAKTFFDNRIKDDALFMQRSFEALPREVAVEYNKIARAAALEPLPSGGTPFRHGGLRRSIVTDVRGDTAFVGWRIPYASLVNAGFHQEPGDPKPRLVKKWTTAGTSGGFVERTQAMADKRITKEIPPILRRLGLTT